MKHGILYPWSSNSFRLLEPALSCHMERAQERYRHTWRAPTPNVGSPEDWGSWGPSISFGCGPNLPAGIRVSKHSTHHLLEVSEIQTHVYVSWIYLRNGFISRQFPTISTIFHYFWYLFDIFLKKHLPPLLPPPPQEENNIIFALQIRLQDLPGALGAIEAGLSRLWVFAAGGSPWARDRCWLGKSLFKWMI